ncbi:MAG: hypothetical protein K1X83_03515 [Oligoflexia bacterium]|nr:hypothetical protein [Oligoflexia bacterium]
MAPDRFNNSKPQVGDLSQERLEALSRPDGDAALQPGPFAGLGEQVRKGVAEVAAQIDDRKRQDPGSSPYGPGSEAAADVPLSAAMGAALDAALLIKGASKMANNASHRQ